MQFAILLLHLNIELLIKQITIMEKELFYIQDLLKENNEHLKVIRKWVAIARWIFIIIPIAAIVLFWGSIVALFTFAG